MAYRGLLEDVPSFGQQFSRSVGAGLSRGIEKASETASKLAFSQQKAKQKETGKLYKTADSFFKKFYPSLLTNEKRYREVTDSQKKYIENGYSAEEALQIALEDMKGSRDFIKDSQADKGPASRNSEEGKVVGGWLGDYLDPAVNVVKKNPSVLGSELITAAGKSAATQRGVHNPLELASMGIAERLAMMAFGPEHFYNPDGSRKKPNSVENMVAGHHRKGMSPEDVEGAERVSDIESLLIDLFTPGLKQKGPQQAKNLFEHAPKSVSRAGEVLANRQKNILTKGVASDVFGSPKNPSPGPAGQAAQTAETAESGLAGRVSGDVSGKGMAATESRVARSNPQGRLFNPEQQMQIREKQLNMFPQYEAEIATDAAERAARAEAKAPKTERGIQGLKGRMAKAQTDLPKAQELYSKAIARVRALEDQMAKGIPEAERNLFDSSLKGAQKELEEAEFYLRQVLNNAKTGESRVGIEQMRDAARQKTISLSEEIAENGSAKIGKADYNPEHIAKAKKLSGKKGIPKSTGDDFYNQVHDEYIKVYRERLGQVEKELESLKAGQGSMSSMQQKGHLEKEKDILNKFIDSAEAEKTIHNHNMALREMGARKTASERFKKLTKQAGDERIKGLAKEAIKGPEEAGAAAEEVVQEAASAAPNDFMRKKILEERAAVKARMESGTAKGGSLNDAIDLSRGTPHSEKEAVGMGKKISRDIQEFIDSLKGSGKNLFSTRIGQDFLSAVLIEGTKTISKELDVPISATAAVAAVAGTAGRGSVYRILISGMISGSVNKYRKENYKDYLRSGNDKKLIELNKDYPAWLRKDAIEEYQDSL